MRTNVGPTARLFGWRGVWRASGRLQLDWHGWRVHAPFSPGGSFRDAGVRVGGQPWQELGLVKLVGTLEGEGSAVRSSA
jgi:hypothetical protein